MSAGAQAYAFYREVSKHGVVWVIAYSSGGAKTVGTKESRLMPLWSSRRRVERIIATVKGYSDGGSPLKVSWADFKSDWVPVISSQDISVGVNWAGPNATGFDMSVELVVRQVEAIAKNGRIGA